MIFQKVLHPSGRLNAHDSGVRGLGAMVGNQLIRLLALAPALCLVAGAQEITQSASVVQTTEAPDPATPFLVGAGLVAVSIIIRRRRKRSANKKSTETPID